ncbi:hypothetical protein MMPV_010081 [Pyropia vietnamensis]
MGPAVSYLTVATRRPPSADLVDWCAASGIAHVTYPAAKYDDEVTVSPAVAAAVVSTLIAPGTAPAFLHCRDGGHNTGLVVACLRRLQGWGLGAVVEEFCRYAKGGEMTREEGVFVEGFRGGRPRWHHRAAVAVGGECGWPTTRVSS